MAGEFLYFLHRNAKVLLVLLCIAAAGLALGVAGQLLTSRLGG